MDYKKEIIDRINKISGKYSPYEVFTDWIRCCSLSIANASSLQQDNIWRKREREYLDTTKRYTEQEIRMFGDMLGLLTMALEEKPEDVLGGIYMAGNMGNKASGQFFTPYHLSELCAKLAVTEPKEDGKIYLNEPSCGGGGMIIATAMALKEKGFNYQKDLEVIAQDLDWKGVYMCYLQLSLLGIRAICVQGDTLREPFTEGYPKERILITPAKRDVILYETGLIKKSDI